MTKKKKIRKVKRKHYFGDNAKDQRNLIYGVVAISAIDALSRNRLQRVV